MKHTLKTIVSVTLLLLVGCTDTGATQERAEALAVECSPLGRYEILATPVPYADAEAACVAAGGTLVEFESTTEIQVVYDAWVQAQYVDETVPSSEGIWVGTWILNVEDTEYGYAMLRGGALFPVLQDDAERLALPACELPLPSLAANNL